MALRSLDGTPLPARPVSTSTLPAVDIDGIDGGNDDGALSTSSYPYTSAWYKSPAATFASAKPVVIKSSGQIVPNVNGILPVAASFSGWQPAERAGGQNPSEKPVSCACADPVDTFSGEFSESTVDLALPGTGPRVQIDRTYSASLAGADGPFGWGSTSSFSAKLVVVPHSENPEPLPENNLLGGAIVTQENGATVTFTMTPQGDYIAPARVNATLTYDFGGDQWVFTRNATDVLRFSEAGAILSHSDLLGNTVTYGTDGSGTITSITGVGGRSITLAWIDGHIASATDSAGRVVSYAYNAQGELASVTAADGRVVSFGYDDAHHVTTVTHPDGGTVTNVYDDQGRVTAQTDALGRVTTFAYSGTEADSTTTVTNPAGVPSAFHYLNGAMESRTHAVGTSSARKTRYVYDAALNVVKQRDPRRKWTVMSYDLAGNMLTLTDPLGHSSSFTYDELNNVTSATDALGRVSTAEYDIFGQKTSATSPSGATSFWQYNPDGTVLTSTDPLGHTTSYSYDAAGRLTSSSDPLGRVSHTRYDTAGHVTSHTDPSGAVTTLSVDARGRTLTATDPLGRVTSYGYDVAGNPSTLTAPDGTVTSTEYDLANQPMSRTDALGYTTTITYTPLGDVAATTNANGAVTTTSYNVLGLPITVTDPKNLKTKTHYDKAGNTTRVRTPAGHITKFSYDAAGRKITSTDPLGNVTNYTYDDANQLVAVTDPLGRTTQMSYDADGWPTSVAGPDGQVETTAYDAAGRKTEYTDADGNVTAFTYDVAGQLTARTAPGGLVTGYQYDPAGRVSLLTKPDGTTIESDYDAAGQLLESIPSAGVGVSFTYDSLGRRVAMTDATGTSHYEYSLTGQLTTVTNGAGLSVGYSYDPAGFTTQLTYPDGKKVNYGYDAAGRMTSLTDWANHKIKFSWSRDSLLAKQKFPNKVTSKTVYDKNDRVSSVTVTNRRAPATTLASYQYGYDAGSQLTSTTIADPLHTDTGGVATNYGYDQRGQLAAAGAEGSFTTTAAGQLTGTPSGSALSYNNAQQLTSLVSASAEVTTDFDYDDNGNRTQSVTSTQSVTGPVTTLGYDFRNNLSSVSSGASGVSYTSNSDGLRQSRTVGSATDRFVWDVAASIPLLLSDGPSLYLYGPGLTPVAQVDASGVIQYLHTDNIGSVRLITDSTGVVVGAADYSPYGAVAAHTGTATSSFGFATAWADPDTHFNYLRARDYDPATGQFLQVDPVADVTHQPYAYVAGDPLASIDPLGLCVGIDGSPQDRNCTYNDYFWDGVWGSIGDEFEIAWAGFSAGTTFGVGLLTNDDFDCYGSNPEFWVEYALGVVVGAASLGWVVAKAAAVPAAAGASGAVGETAIPIAEGNAAHIFRNATGHLVADTAASRAVIQSAVRSGTLVRTTPQGVQTFRTLLSDGTEAWAEVFRGEITNGGVNLVPRGP